jgi:TonB family protein
VISKVEPVYSAEAKDAKHQGEVVLSAIVDTTGIPRDIVTVKTLGLGLDEAAADAVRQWRFSPALKDGEPVPVKVTISVGFHTI